MKTFKDWVLFFCVVGLDSLESDNGNYGIVTVTENE